MINFRCSCGAPIGMPDHAAGKTAKCMTCGSRLVVPALVQSPVAAPAGADDDIPLELEPEPQRPVTRAPGALPPREPERPAALHTKYQSSSREAHEAARAARADRSYLADALSSFIKVLAPVGLGVIVMIGVALIGLTFFQSLGPRPWRLGGFLILISYGALVAYAYQVIVNTAGGEDDMPSLFFDDWWVEAATSLFSMLGALLALAAPAIVVAIGFTMAGADPEVTGWAVAIAGFLGVFFLPATVLAVAMGGLSVLARFDLIARTVAAAPVQYIALWVLILIGLGVSAVVGLYSTSASGGFSPLFVFAFLEVYFVLVVARQIGLFYRHFSDRFPWSAG